MVSKDLAPAGSTIGLVQNPGEPSRKHSVNTWMQLRDNSLYIYVFEEIHAYLIIWSFLRIKIIMLEKWSVPGHLRLADFGLSRRLERGGRAFTICGTIQYMGEMSRRHLHSYLHTM